MGVMKKCVLWGCAVMLLGCSGDDIKEQIQDVVNDFNTENAFPAEVAVASPTDFSNEFNTAKAGVLRAATGPATSSRYAWAVTRIGGLLTGDTPMRDVFDGDMFLRRPVDADCFGPTLYYENHPDGTDGSAFVDPVTGTTADWPALPSGDLGLWQEVDSATGHACAAAEMNAQMQAVSGRSLMALMSLAAMLSAANDAGMSLPSPGGTEDYLSAMSGLGLSDVTFSEASLSLNSGADTWTYALGLTYTDADGNAHDINIDLTHMPGSGSAVSYEGMLTYQVDDYFQGGHCAPATEVTYNGTVYYNRSSETALLINARDGMYCGHGKSAVMTTDTDVDAGGTFQFLDPSDGLNMTTMNGWANNFSMVGAQFNPATLEGQYVYAWQAGSNDSNSRVLNVGMNYHDGDSSVDGEAYYGFGDAVDATDGSILGFYCNWAGPGADRNLLKYAQRQFITYNTTSGLFEVPAGGSDIVYAPTNSCTYDGSPAGFWYDRDLNATQDEANVDIYVHAVGAAPDSSWMELDMLGPADTDGDTTATIPEAIAERGFTLPPF